MYRQRAVISRLHYDLPASTVQQRLPGRTSSRRHRIPACLVLQLVDGSRHSGASSFSVTETVCASLISWQTDIDQYNVTCHRSFLLLFATLETYSEEEYMSIHCVQKKTPTYSFFISPWMIWWFKQKLQWIYLRNGKFWKCTNYICIAADDVIMTSYL